MTANAFDEDRRAALEAGMNAHLAKRIVRKDGSLREIDDIGHNRFVENGVPVFCVYLADVTEHSVISE